MLEELLTAGEQIQAVDVRVNGTLHQRWTDVDFDGIPDPTPTGNASDGRGDSHLTSPGNARFALGASENNSGSGSPLADVPAPSTMAWEQFSGRLGRIT